jgi:hypothetical protein
MSQYESTSESDSIFLYILEVPATKDTDIFLNVNSVYVVGINYK